MNSYIAPLLHTECVPACVHCAALHQLSYNQVCVLVCLRVRLCVCMSVDVCLYVGWWVGLCVYVRACVRVCVCVCAYIYMNE